MTIQRLFQILGIPPYRAHKKHQHVHRHKHNKLFDALPKAKAGCGGVNCHCCRPKVWGKNWKAKSWRMLRRKEKQNIC